MDALAAPDATRPDRAPDFTLTIPDRVLVAIRAADLEIPAVFMEWAEWWHDMASNHTHVRGWWAPDHRANGNAALAPIMDALTDDWRGTRTRRRG